MYKNLYRHRLPQAFCSFVLCVKIIVVCLLTIWTGERASAQNADRFFNEISGPEMMTGNSFMVTDDRFRDDSWSEIKKTTAVNGYIALEINDDAQVISKDAFVCQVSVRIDLWNSNNDSSAVFKDLSVTFDPGGQSAFMAKDGFHFKDAHEFRVTILDIKTISREDAAKTVAVLPVLKITGYLEAERSLSFSCSSTTQVAHSYNDENGRLTLAWDPVTGAEQYELEWTYYDVESKFGQSLKTGPPITLADYEKIFKNNATRIITSGAFYELPVVYPEGYIFYRVRGAGPDLTDGFWQTTLWSHPGGGGLISAFPAIFYIDPALNQPHEPDLNWQTSTIFAEEAKNAQTVTYADALPRMRQEVSLSRADDLIIVKEQIYDRHGRPALQLMPAPVDKGAAAPGTYENRLGFVPEFAKDNASGEYNFEDFDMGEGCKIVDVPPMNTQFGAAKYYSPFNILANAPVEQSIQRFIPDANGFPFAITEFTPDGTGRIKRQGGVGEIFQTDGEHATNYFYGKANQEELDMLFDAGDVGNAVHYQKNMVQDPNGQLSVSYVDAGGRTIATALAGSSPENLDPLDPAIQPNELQINLLNNVVRDASILSTYTLLVSESGEYTIDYDMSVAGYNETCMDQACYDCVYDLTITVTDNCSGLQVVPAIIKTNINLPTPSHFCDVLTPGFNESFPAALEVGEYTITKTLTVSKAAVEYYAAQYLQTDCMPDLQTTITTFVAEADPDCGQFDCDDCIAEANAYLTAHPADTDTYNQMLEACHVFCEGDTIRPHCEIFYETLLADVSPGGQYMKVGFTFVAFEEVETCEVAPSDPASLFYPGTPSNPLTPPYQLPEGGFYRNDDGSIATVNIDGVEFFPHELNVCDFIKYWQPSWAYALVKKHPEYCLYDSCVAHSDSEEYNRFLMESDVFPYMGVELDVFNNDPYFTNQPGIQHAQEMQDFITHFSVNPQNSAEFYSLGEIIITNIACNSVLPLSLQHPPCSTFTELCATDQTLVWRMFRAAYLGKKYSFFSTDIADSGCEASQCVGMGTLKTNACPPGLTNKIKRWITNEYATLTSVQAHAQAVNGFMNNCAEIADGVVDSWIFALKSGGCFEIDDPGFPIVQFKSQLKNIFLVTCDTARFYGALNDPLNAVFPSSVREALEAALSVLHGMPVDITDCSAGCNDLFITFPGSYNRPQRLGGQQPEYLKDGTCVCDNLQTVFQDCWNSGVYNTQFSNFLDFVNHYSDVKLTQEELDALQADCNNENCHSFSDGVKIPPQFKCNVCVPGMEVAQASESFNVLCHNAPPELYAAYLNRVLGLNLEYEDYDAFLTEYYGLTPQSDCYRSLVLCPKSIEAPEYNCYQEQVEILTNAAIDAYNAEVAYRIEEFKKRYLSHCLAPLETFVTSEGIREQQFTLYYYDRAGQLVQTVPPQGVVPGSPVLHTMRTTYRYDCFGNAVERITPDGGTTRTWYDFLGRPVVSQDARQAALGLYSYTIYDGLGRPVETGEKQQASAPAPQGGPITNAIARNQQDLSTWVNFNAGTLLTDITRTYYDAAVIDWSGIAQPNVNGWEQQNLRKRVSSVFFQSAFTPRTDPIDPELYDYATHYSYDIAGNAQTLVQDIREMGESGPNRYKRIDYDYDIVSGKVNRVNYQQDMADEFYHRYTYDANNRLTVAETSFTGDIGDWETDADYEYYYHGPLGRSVIGERKVQGTDLAYTLQGWIKGVNASAMKAFSDGADIPEYLYIHDENIPSGVYRARTGIYSHGHVHSGSVVEFRAGKFIELQEDGDGFRADLGSDFLAIIDPALIEVDPEDIVDMGRDGALTDARPLIARDAFSYTISYFENDYQKVSALATAPDFEISKNYGGFYTLGNDVFNGNIRHIAQQVKTLTASAFEYHYDQLHRLKSMTYWNRPEQGVWGASSAYQEQVTYDRNGNILTYNRNAGIVNNNVVALDQLTYKYQGTGGPNPTNRLLQVIDSQTDDNVSLEDVDDGQGAANYTYDAAGNLIADASHGTTFSWSMYGKLKSVHGVDGPDAIFYGYDAMQKRVMKKYRDATVPNPSLYMERREFYIRDAQGNTMATYKQAPNDDLVMADVELYGSARLGVFHAGLELFHSDESPLPPKEPSMLGKKEYELVNHLANVMATVRDEVDMVDIDNDGNADYYEPRVSSAREYYPFGMLMPGRKAPSYLNTSYRYAFNGKESDDDAGYGDDGFQDYGMRMYMPGLSRFFSVDPLADSYAWNSTYAFAENDVIRNIDLDGGEKKPAHYKAISSFYKTYIQLKKGGLGPVFRDKKSSNVDIYESILDYYEYGVGFVNDKFNYGQIYLFADYYKNNVITSRNDCITVMCGAINRVMGTHIQPDKQKPGFNLENGSVEHLSDALKIQGVQTSPPIEVKFTGKGDRGFKTGDDHKLKESIANKLIESTGKQKGYFVFVLSFAEGFHSMLVVVDNTDLDLQGNGSMFYFGDQGTVVNSNSSAVGAKGWSANGIDAKMFDEAMNVWNGTHDAGFIDQGTKEDKPYYAPIIRAWQLYRKR